MTPSVQAYLLDLVASQRERAEAMRALALERGLSTAPFDELLLSAIALEREITGQAFAVIPPDWEQGGLLESLPLGLDRLLCGLGRGVVLRRNYGPSAS